MTADQHHHPDDELLAALSDEWGREPWEPPGRRFEVRQRVRIRYSAECDADWGPGSTRRGHDMGFDGLEGTITLRLGADEPHSHHPYAVDFDAPVWCPHCNDFAIGVYLSAAEMIPLADEPARPSAEQEEGR